MMANAFDLNGIIGYSTSVMPFSIIDPITVSLTYTNTQVVK